MRSKRRARPGWAAQAFAVGVGAWALACSSASAPGSGDGATDVGSDVPVADAHDGTVADVATEAASEAAVDASFDAPDAMEVGLAADALDAEAATDALDSETDAQDAAVPDADAGGCAVDGAVPDDLACTGLYGNWAAKTIAPDAVPYTPGLVFWSDGAVKSRWIHLPAGATIDTSDPDNWVFPEGTKIWKAFSVGGQLVETRLIWKTAVGWTFLVYRWSADGSTARRLESGETNVNGTTYEIPSTNACIRCHGGRLDSVLGVDWIGLGIGAAQGITLTRLATEGRFSVPLPSTTVTIPEDSTGKAAAALGWLHVNCGSSCHNASPVSEANATGLYLKLLASQVLVDGGTGAVAGLDSYTTAVGRMSQRTPNGVHYLRIAPGNSAQSLLVLFDSSRDAGTGFMPMPPLVSHIPDTAGVGLVSAWIDALGQDH